MVMKQSVTLVISGQSASIVRYTDAEGVVHPAKIVTHGRKKSRLFIEVPCGERTLIVEISEAGVNVLPSSE